MTAPHTTTPGQRVTAWAVNMSRAARGRRVVETLSRCDTRQIEVSTYLGSPGVLCKPGNSNHIECVVSSHGNRFTFAVNLSV